MSVLNIPDENIRFILNTPYIVTQYIGLFQAFPFKSPHTDSSYNPVSLHTVGLFCYNPTKVFMF